jgi:FkbM family methyltransferase
MLGPLGPAITSLVRSCGYSIKLDPVRPSRRTKRLTLHHTATGNYYLPTDAKGDGLANLIIAGEIGDPWLMDIATKYIQPGTTVLDVGSNFGQMAVLFSNFAARVHAFEAEPWVYEILTKNIIANRNDDLRGIIVPHYGAVWEEEGKTFIFPEVQFEEGEVPCYGSHGLDFNATNGREVKSITVDSLCICEKVSFMKTDVEGCDLQAMRGARRTIEKNRMPIVFEYAFHLEEKFGMHFQDYVDFVASIGYKFDKTNGGYNYLILPEEM